jgi:hypothetical protein
VQTGFDWLQMHPVVGCCKHGNKTSGSIKDGEFLDELSAYKLLKTCFVLSSYYHNQFP